MGGLEQDPTKRLAETMEYRVTIARSLRTDPFTHLSLGKCVFLVEH